MVFTLIKKMWFVCILVMILFVLPSFAFANTYSVNYGNCIATVTNIECDGDILLISFDFTNNGSSGSSFSWSYTIKGFQEGIECSNLYFNSRNKNQGISIKDGASIEVVDTLKLNNRDAIVDIEIGSWGLMLHSIHVYFNPVSGLWGEKDEISLTPIPLATISFDTSVEETEWICPSCGKRLSSNFCPDCGNSSPTPQPTPVITPSPQWVCPSCGKLLESKFCPDCGTASPTPPVEYAKSFSFAYIELSKYVVSVNSVNIPFKMIIDYDKMPIYAKNASCMNIKVEVRLYEDSSKSNLLKSEVRTVSVSKNNAYIKEGIFDLFVSKDIIDKMDNAYCECEILNYSLSNIETFRRNGIG